MANACLGTRTGWLSWVGGCQQDFFNFPATSTMSSAWWLWAVAPNRINAQRLEHAFLETQVSLAPQSVRWLVCPSYFWISIAPEHFCATVVFDDHPHKKSLVWSKMCFFQYFPKVYFLKVCVPKNLFFQSVFFKVYLSKVYFCEMYPTCVSSKLSEFTLREAFL